MKAIVCTKYGAPDVLRLREVEKPVPKDNEVLIKIYAATATASGLNGRKDVPFFARLLTGLTKPKKDILGAELAGEIDWAMVRSAGGALAPLTPLVPDDTREHARVGGGRYPSERDRSKSFNPPCFPEGLKEAV